jgi:hypothetical protein
MLTALHFRILEYSSAVCIKQFDFIVLNNIFSLPLKDIMGTQSQHDVSHKFIVLSVKKIRDGKKLLRFRDA